MTILNAGAKLVKDFRVDVDDGRSHAVCLDLDRDSDGTDLGPSALELALMSFAGCYVTIFARTARKMRFALRDLEVRCEATKSEDVGTITEVDFDVIVNTPAPKDRIERMHEVTIKTCPVGLLFEKAGVKTRSTLKIVP